MTNPRAESATHQNINERSLRKWCSVISPEVVPLSLPKALREDPEVSTVGACTPGHRHSTVHERGSSGTSLWNCAALVLLCLACFPQHDVLRVPVGDPRQDSSLCRRSTVPGVFGALCGGRVGCFCSWTLSSTHLLVWYELS